MELYSTFLETNYSISAGLTVVRSTLQDLCCTIRSTNWPLIYNISKIQERVGIAYWFDCSRSTFAGFFHFSPFHVLHFLPFHVLDNRSHDEGSQHSNFSSKIKRIRIMLCDIKQWAYELKE